MCAVTLTNTNSIGASCNQLRSYIFKVASMIKEGHPFGEIIGRMLGMPLAIEATNLVSGFSQEKLGDTLIDYYLHLRNTFVDKIEQGTPNSLVTIR